jgi:hypothetical protein
VRPAGTAASADAGGVPAVLVAGRTVMIRVAVASNATAARAHDVALW